MVRFILQELRDNSCSWYEKENQFEVVVVLKIGSQVHEPISY